MIKVGITGQSGFIGSNLFNHLSLKNNEIKLINFKDEYFDDDNVLKDFVKNCDIIVHLAALNRHNKPEEIYNTNIKLVEKLIDIADKNSYKPHIIFSSSTQEYLDNPYGRSKKIGRKLFVDWAKKADAKFTGLIIPNVYGPFGQPFYNSVISTFSHQIVNNETPRIEIDSEMKLIYVFELAEIIYKIIMGSIPKNDISGESDVEFTKRNSDIIEETLIPYFYKIKVSGLLKVLTEYKETYFDNGIFPLLKNKFQLNLFNTFRSYIDTCNYFPRKLKLNTDERGSFIEVIKNEGTGGQTSFSTTKKNITRGNHFHTRKIERFIVISGNAEIKMRKINTNEILTFNVSGNEPSFIDMPVWYTHNIKNTGEGELLTLFWINELFDKENPDTFFENV